MKLNFLLDILLFILQVNITTIHVLDAHYIAQHSEYCRYLYMCSGITVSGSMQYNFNSSINSGCQDLNTIDLGVNESFTLTLHSSIKGVEFRQTHVEVIVQGYSKCNVMLSS